MFKFNKIKSCKGLTFLETLFALIILAVAMVGYSQIFSIAIKSSSRAKHDIIALNLAAGLLAEIMARDFEEAGSPGSFTREEGDNRYEFDDIDDYHNWSENPPKTAGKSSGGGYLDMNGTSGTPNYSKYTRSVVVSFAILEDDGDVVDDAGPTDYKKVTVTVSSPFGKDVSVIKLVSNAQ